jgi:hypothetical protein
VVAVVVADAPTEHVRHIDSHLDRLRNGIAIVVELFDLGCNRLWLRVIRVRLTAEQPASCAVNVGVLIMVDHSSPGAGIAPAPFIAEHKLAFLA